MSKWYKASELERARTPMVMSSEMGLPDNHVITVTERVISIDNTELIQNNIATDTFTLVLDAEWDDITPVVIFSNGTGKYSVMYEGSATKIPAKAMERVGDIQVSVYGLNDEGDVRVVTQKPDSMGMTVIESGEFNGQISSDDVSLLGQILQAVSDAEAAITEAETATTAATNATNQATSAATSANQAASSANTAASSANSAATRATSAAVNAENAYDTLKPYMATIDSCANILHREVGPDSVVTADDSFPAKPVEMVVYGNTVQNLWVNPSGSVNGVTFTPNSDGSISISGSPTGSNKRVDSEDIYVLKPNAQYTISIDRTLGLGSYVLLVGHDADGNQVPNSTAVVVLTGNETFETFTVPSGVVSCTCSMQVNSNGTTSGTYRVMLNEGSTAKPWCPPGLNSVGDGGSVKVVTAGKNLFGISQEFGDLSGWQSTQLYDEGDGWIRAESASGVMGIWYKKSKIRLMPTTYTVSFEAYANKSTVVDYNYIMVSDGANVDLRQHGAIHPTATTERQRISFSFTLDKELNGSFMIGVTNAAGVELHVRNVQLELGSTATDYEPPNITITPIDLQGHTLNALPDGTRDELHIDGGGNVVLEKRIGCVDSTNSFGSYGATPPCFGCSDAPYSMPTTTIGNIFTNGLKVAIGGGTRLWPNYAAGLAENADIHRVYVKGAEDDVTVSDLKNTMESVNALVLYPLAEPQTIDLGTITPPTMTAPNVTAYVADDTPAEMGLDYVRDINIVVDRLEAKISDLVTKEAANV